MFLYRIGKTKYAKELKGKGAKMNGGRWNYEGVACIYTAQSRALSLVEYSAHVSLEDLPRALCFTTFDVPDSPIFELEIDVLPENWDHWPYPKETRDFGSELLRKNEYLLFKFPSAIVPFEYNYLINPQHKEMTNVTIMDVIEYSYDTRLKK
jgi:RES domain-containing protein